MRKIIFGLLLTLMLIPQAWAATASLQNIQGEVLILKHGTKDWATAKDAEALEAGDKIKTGAHSSVDIQMDKGLVSLGEKTEFGLKELEFSDDQLKASLELTLGKLKAKVEKLKEGSQFKITTPTAVASVRGTLFDMWVFDYLGELFTRLGVEEGLMKFCTLDEIKCEDVAGGEHGTAGSGGVTPPETEDKPVSDEFNAQEGFDQQNEHAQEDIKDLFFPSDESSDEDSYRGY